MNSLVILPAVDVQNGQAVQLVQGVAGSEKTFGDPLAAALHWQDAGAQWLHLVDLNAAFGQGDNSKLLSSMINQLELKVELSGGIRDTTSLEAALETGCSRVNIGTAALENPKWCKEMISCYGERIAISLDIRGNNLAARGWTTEGGRWEPTLDELSEAGCARFVVTDVTRDGMLNGPNFDLLQKISARTSAAVVASGGISKLQDLVTLLEKVPNIEGAIIGTALYMGNFTLSEALSLVAG